MGLPRIRLRTLMIAVAVFAPFLLLCSWLYHLSTAMEDFYGARGKLALEQAIGSEFTAGLSLLHQAHFTEAEGRYRSALALNQELASTSARHGWRPLDRSPELLLGLASSLAGQRRDAEAEIVASLIPDNFLTADFLERFGALKRQLGKTARANGLFARAKALRDNGELHEH